MKKIISILFMFAFMFNAYASQGVVAQCVDNCEAVLTGRSWLSLALQYDSYDHLEDLLEQRKLEQKEGDNIMELFFPKERTCSSEVYYREVVREGKSGIPVWNNKPVVELLLQHERFDILEKIYLPMVFQFRKLAFLPENYIKSLFFKKIISANDIKCDGISLVIWLIKKNRIHLAWNIIKATDDADLCCVDEKGNTLLLLAARTMFTATLNSETRAIRWYNPSTSPCSLPLLLIEKNADLLAKNEAGETFFDMVLSMLTHKPEGEQAYIADDIVWRYSNCRSVIRIFIPIIDKSNIDPQEKQALIKRLEAAHQQLQDDFQAGLKIRKANKKKNESASGEKSKKRDKIYFKKTVLKALSGITIVGLLYYLYNYGNISQRIISFNFYD